MKLAEALILRADAQTRIQQLRDRLVRSARVQEGDTAPENPQELLEELARTVAQWTDIVQKINRTNSQTPMSADSTRTLTDALAERDALAMERGVLQSLVQEATMPVARMAQSNIKVFRSVDVAAIQRRMDALARQRRDLDTAIQALNWTVDLVE
jgi:polyhydroxyalkanoate synthesis regulator phasin